MKKSQRSSDSDSPRPLLYFNQLILNTYAYVLCSFITCVQRSVLVCHRICCFQHFIICSPKRQEIGLLHSFYYLYSFLRPDTLSSSYNIHIRNNTYLQSGNVFGTVSRLLATMGKSDFDDESD